MSNGDTYYRTVRADRAWQAELVRVYGLDRAADYRYDTARNVSTPELARLHGEFRAAVARQHEEMLERLVADSETSGGRE